MHLKKILVRKFRYNGLLRPKWVSYHFFGLDKLNPNGRKWQPRAGQYIKNSLKIAKHVYIWLCRDSFYQLPITLFCLKQRVQSQNYYAFKNNLDKNLNRLITERLKYDLKIKLYYKQNGLCAICNDILSPYELSTRSSKIHVHCLRSCDFSKGIQALNNKSYQKFSNKMLLHANCRFAIYTNKFYQG